jgi:dTDP-L-rhamnose 4-epimerase
MTRRRSAGHALVTGGAGLIGSHIVDLLLEQEWSVRVLDNLEPQTHRNGKPSWVSPAAEFMVGDVRDAATLEAALDGIDIVFHEAAYGGYMPEIAKFIDVNCVGTARLLEIIRDEHLPIKKVIVASSQAVYSEGAGVCAQHGLVFPMARSVEQLSTGNFMVVCPECGAPTTSAPTPEHAPIRGENVYAISKVDQERLVLTWGKQTGIPTVALRYSCTYGPRQSMFNPYTGVIAIFASRLLSGRPPILYEDGYQTRDLTFVHDIAQANFLAATTSALDGLAVNIGSGVATSILDIAALLAEALDSPIQPLARGEFRPGEIRHLTSDITLARSAGYAPSVDLKTGVARYLEWIRNQGSVQDYFAGVESILHEKRIVRPIEASHLHVGVTP